MAHFIAAIILLAVGAPQAKVYEVRYVANPQIVLDGHATEPAWQQANLLRDFRFPWTSAPPPPTEFRALCDDDYLYFTFRAVDSDIVAVPNVHSEMDVASEDRVELFFAPDLKLATYYCVELDSRSRHLDYRAAYYRKFDPSWNFPGLLWKASTFDKGYVVEGRFRLASLRELGLPSLESGNLRIGVFRAQFSHGPAGTILEDWIPWVNPQTPKPDFHVPTSFGLFKKVR